MASVQNIGKEAVAWVEQPRVIILGLQGFLLGVQALLACKAHAFSVRHAFLIFRGVHAQLRFLFFESSISVESKLALLFFSSFLLQHVLQIPTVCTVYTF